MIKKWNKFNEDIESFEENNKIYESDVVDMLNKKKEELVEFLNSTLTDDERSRFGEDIIRLFPNEGDVSKIKLDRL